MAETLTAALEREHHEIDAGIEAFLDGLSHGEPRTVELSRAVDALRRHIYLEEEFLFPPLRAAGLLPPVLVMLREHGEIWRVLDALEADDATTSPDDAREHCDELLTLLTEHNAKEEPIIYPHADADLPTESSAELRAFLEAGSTPDGWVCEGAR